MSKPILYDLAGHGGKCWSPNPWKTRMVLNYKGVDYDSVFLEFQDIKPTLSALGLEANDAGHSFSVPAVKLSDGTVAMDSAKIAPLLEAAYPSPPLHVDAAIQPQVLETMGKFMGQLFPDLAPRIRRTFVNDASAAYFDETREKMFGMPLEQVQREKGGDKAWNAARDNIMEMARLLKANGGPFFMGETVSYADFPLASMLHWFKLLGDGVYERFVAHDQAFDALHKACEPWFARDY